MLTVTKVANERVAVKLSGDTFYQLLSMIKSLPREVRDYDSEEKLWYIDKEELARLIAQLDNSEVSYAEGLSPENTFGDKMPTLEEIYGIPINRVGREFLKSDTVKDLPYQDVAACFLYYKRRALCADEVGIGKTIEALLTIAKGIALGEVRRGGHILVLTESGLVHAYAKEILDKTVFTVLSVRGTAKQRRQKWEMVSDYDIIVAGHEQLREDLDYEYMKKMDLDMIVVDEVAKFNHRSSQLHKRLFELSKPQHIRLAMFTATPATGQPIDNIYNLMRLINPDILGKVTHFNEKYTYRKRFVTSTGQSFFKNVPKPGALAEVRTKIRPYILERTCADVGLVKPDLINSVHYVEMTDTQRRLTLRSWEAIQDCQSSIAKLREEHDQIRLQLSNLGNEDEDKLARLARIAFKISRLENKIKALFVFMRLVADGMEILKDNKHFEKLLGGVTDWSTPKVDYLVRLLYDLLPHSKVVIHTDFRSNIPVITSAIQKEFNIPVLTIQGGDKDTCSQPPDSPCGSCPYLKNCSTRRKAQWLFTNSDNYKVILLTSAGEKGLNLQVARYQINYDLPWNSTSLIQRGGRIHRYGSEYSTVYTVSLVSIDSIEEIILDYVLQRKSSQINSLIRSSEAEVKYIYELTKKLSNEK